MESKGSSPFRITQELNYFQTGNGKERCDGSGCQICFWQRGFETSVWHRAGVYFSFVTVENVVPDAAFLQLQISKTIISSLEMASEIDAKLQSCWRVFEEDNLWPLTTVEGNRQRRGRRASVLLLSVRMCSFTLNRVSESGLSVRT